MSTPKPSILYVDQHKRLIWARTVRDLRDRAGGGRISKMYRDKADGRIVHIGYVIGRRWFSAYVPLEKPFA
jgi:hypothetical protein